MPILEKGFRNHVTSELHQVYQFFEGKHGILDTKIMFISMTSNHWDFFSAHRGESRQQLG